MVPVLCSVCSGAYLAGEPFTFTFEGRKVRCLLCGLRGNGYEVADGELPHVLLISKLAAVNPEVLYSFPYGGWVRIFWVFSGMFLFPAQCLNALYLGDPGPLVPVVRAALLGYSSEAAQEAPKVAWLLLHPAIRAEVLEMLADRLGQ